MVFSQKETRFLGRRRSRQIFQHGIEYQKSRLGEVPMPSPFPGMNPYLENPLFWHQIHKWLTLLIAEIMNPKIRPKYWVSVEERVYQTTGNGDGTLLVGIPGNVVIGQSRVNIVPPSTGSVAVAAPLPSQFRSTCQCQKQLRNGIWKYEEWGQMKSLP